MDTSPAPVAPPRFPASKRSSYQFPVYKWIGWLTVAGFAIGLTVMFFIANLFGVPAPLAWAVVVIIFTAGAMLLDRPRLLLNVMIFYFLLMPGNRVLGLIGLPLPSFIDELFFLPFIAVIVMNWIQRRQLAEATIFPVAFCLIAGTSWYVNGKPSPFVAVQVTLVMMKFYILWYFCRLTCTFESVRQLSKWVWLYIVYVAIQFPYNLLWQRTLWPSRPDRSGGVFGPDTSGAHLVGYLSIVGLLLMAGWAVSSVARASLRVKWAIALLALVIGYNLIFMTDTKHALLLFPLVYALFLVHPKFPARMRVGLVILAAMFMLAASAYFKAVVGTPRMSQYLESVRDSPKGDLFYAVTADFSHLVPYPLLGAGPGRFTSNQARDNRVPLARRYVLPYYDQERRMGLFGVQGRTITASVIGAVNTDFFVLMGEFGWLSAVLYYWFLGWVAVKLFRKSTALPGLSFQSGIYLSLASCVVFLSLVSVITFASTVQALVFPLWMLIGRVWDMLPEPEAGGGGAAA